MPAHEAERRVAESRAMLLATTDNVEPFPMKDHRSPHKNRAMFVTAALALILWCYLVGTLAAALGVPRIV
jgi:hypothetical protein